MRALRVYERHGLIKPARSAKGWRLYGPDELIRLNTIVALKSFGLTLAQIRKAFGESTPALAQVFDMQLKVWASRKLAADHAMAQIHAALGRLQSRAPLSIDELCELLRNADMSNLQSHHARTDQSTHHARAGARVVHVLGAAPDRGGRRQGTAGRRARHRRRLPGAHEAGSTRPNRPRRRRWCKCSHDALAETRHARTAARAARLESRA